MNLGPQGFVSLIKQQPASALSTLGPLMLLLVELDDKVKEFGGFFELMWSEEADLISEPKSGSSPSATRIGPMPKAKEGRKRDRIEEFTPKLVQKRLKKGSHAVVVINKRGQGPDTLGTPKVSVGRSRSSDLVLLHPSVSLKHALLDCDPEGVYFVKDVGSTNGTMVNGRRLAPDEYEDVYPGDELVFGQVETTLCTFETLWRAIHEG